VESKPEVSTLVVGYHGTTQSQAARILSRTYPLLERRTADWLGDGLYFWQDAPFRALWWAERRTRRTDETPAVVRAVVDLNEAIDLLDRSPFVETLLSLAYRVANAPEAAPLRNLGDDHALDCAVINAAVEYRQIVFGAAHRVVRGVFVNERPRPYFAGSALLREAHVQIAVRDWSAILAAELVDLDELRRGA
jgi:hypothetical protein